MQRRGFVGLTLTLIFGSIPACFAQSTASKGDLAQAFEKADERLAADDYAGSRDVLLDALKSAGRSNTNSSYTALALLRIGSLDLDLGSSREAEKAYLEALSLWEKGNPPKNLDRGFVLAGLQDVYMRNGKLTKAEECAREALEVRQKALGPNAAGVGTPIQNLAAVYQIEHRYAEALDLYRRAIDIFERSGAAWSPAMAAARGNLAMMWADEGQFDTAIREAETSLSILQVAIHGDGPQFARALYELADIECRGKRWVEAVEPIRQAKEITVRLFGKRHPMLAPILRIYAKVSNHTGHKRDARKMLEEADEISRESSRSNLIGYTVDAQTYRARKSDP
jgi:tetratricopeptide (TPR) repeat protein